MLVQGKVSLSCGQPCHHPLPCGHPCQARTSAASRVAAALLPASGATGAPGASCGHLMEEQKMLSMQELCHGGPCPQACAARVTVRCACRRKRAKMACSEAAAALKAQGLAAPADPGAAVRLLDCDASCQVCPP